MSNKNNIIYYINGVLYNYCNLCFQGIFKNMEKYPWYDWVTYGRIENLCTVCYKFCKLCVCVCACTYTEEKYF